MGLNVTNPTSTAPSKIGSLRGLESLERRREARYPTNKQAKVEVICGGPLRQSARILDVSRSGLRLEVETFIGKGLQAEIILPEHMVIFGEVRYCRRGGSGFHAGILIQNVFQPRRALESHVHDDLLDLYLVGKGLTFAEVITLREHLNACDSCRTRLTEKDAVLNPRRRRKLPGSGVAHANCSDPRSA